MAPSSKNGQLLVADLVVAPKGAVIGEHYHPTVYEKLTVIEGELSYTLAGKAGLLRSGQSVEIFPGVRHDWWNESTRNARVIVEVQPGNRFAQMIQTTFGLAADGKTNKKGMPNLLQLAVISREFKDVMRVCSPPVWLQNIIFSFLVPIARLLGYKATYAHHQQRTGVISQIPPLPEGVTIRYSE